MFLVSLCSLSYAQARLWVSGTGSDSSLGSSRAFPCATFAFAIRFATPGGEIDALDLAHGETVPDALSTLQRLIDRSTRQKPVRT